MSIPISILLHRKSALIDEEEPLRVMFLFMNESISQIFQPEISNVL